MALSIHGMVFNSVVTWRVSFTLTQQSYSTWSPGSAHRSNSYRLHTTQSNSATLCGMVSTRTKCRPRNSGKCFLAGKVTLGLIMYLILCGIFAYRINGLRKGLERQAYAFIAVMHSLLFICIHFSDNIHFCPNWSKARIYHWNLLKPLNKRTSLTVKPSSVTICTISGRRFHGHQHAF